jgi:hypothetical protein
VPEMAEQSKDYPFATVVLSKQFLYPIVSGKKKNLFISTVLHMLWTLNKITGKNFKPNDIIEYEEILK